ncbi:MAG TPA: transketolase C-terminal domain-containing protein, partial [Bacteroidota bacterium]|nr:transketolase C-terminal domain-containing protein [Bacteroidota bacterium]
DGDVTVPIGRGDVKREGDDAVIFTYGSTVGFSLEAAHRVAQEDGRETKVVDLRTLLPLDRDLIIGAVRATGKVLIVHEDTLTGGVGGEVAALVAEHAFQYLDAPVKRVGALDAPVPFSPTLEEAHLPDTGKITAALRELLRY